METKVVKMKALEKSIKSHKEKEVEKGKYVQDKE